MGIEREMKFDLAAAVEPDLEGLGAAVGARRSIELVADYWDTRSGHLRAWGITVRHRRSDDGTEDGWTVKIPVPPSPRPGRSVTGNGNGTTNGNGNGNGNGYIQVRRRVEIDVAGDPDVPPSRVLAIVSGLACTEPFERVAHLVTDRRSVLLVESSGRGQVGRGGKSRDSDSDAPEDFAGAVRVDRDHVTAFTADGVAEFDQLEVEWAGSDELWDRVTDWAHRSGLRPTAATNKLEQAPGPGRIRAPKVPHLGPRSRLHKVVRAALAAPVADLLAHDPLLRAEVSLLEPIAHRPDREPPTPRWRPDVTVLAGALDAADRLRSSVRSFLTVLDADVVGPMLTEIDLWAQVLADLHDLDALRRRLAPLGHTDRFVTRLDDQLDLQGRQVSAILHQPWFRGLLGDLVALASGPELAADVDGRCRSAEPLTELNATLWSKLADAVTRVDDTGPGATASDDATRALDDPVRRAATTARLTAPVLGPSADEAADRLDALHRRLVDRHEALMLQRWIEHFVAVSGPELDAATAFRAGELHMAARLDPARTADWRRSWRRARRRRPERW